MLVPSTVQPDDANGGWIRPPAGWARYQPGFDANNEMDPTLHELVRLTGESASFYVRECATARASRAGGPQSVRHNVRISERLPLNKGAPGRVIFAFSGEKGKV